jgi:hypothetical protein
VTAGNEGPEPQRKPGRCSHLFVGDEDRLLGRYGSSCRACPLTGKVFCGAHDPEHRLMMTARKEARQVVRDESKALLRGEQVALKEAAIQRVRAGEVARLAAREVARAVGRAVPDSVRVAHRRAQLMKAKRLRITLDLSPDEVASLPEWFEHRGDGTETPPPAERTT